MKSTARLSQPETQAREPNSIGKLVGAKMSVLRLEKQMTLESLAAGTGLTPSFLSKLERGQTSVSVDNLGNIARFLGQDMGYLLDDDQSQPLVIVTRRGQGTTLRMANTKADVESLVPISRSVLQVTLHRTPPGKGRAVGFLHPGEEIIYVIAGQIRYWVNDQAFMLKAGDTIWHPSTQPHRYENCGKRRSLTLHVNTPPVWFHLDPLASGGRNSARRRRRKM
jgi:transcriptional regulator with XRE-family HTH domain